MSINMSARGVPLPHDLPRWQTVSGYFRLWTKTGVWERINAALCDAVRVAEDAATTLPNNQIANTAIAINKHLLRAGWPGLANSAKKPYPAGNAAGTLCQRYRFHVTCIPKPRDNGGTIRPYVSELGMEALAID